MKRRVASLPPVSLAVFNQKVLERKVETAVTTSPKGSICEVCNKNYTTENAYRSHINSKKHKENEAKAALQPKVTKPADSKSTEAPPQPEDTESPPPPPAPVPTPTQTVDTDKANEDDEEQTIEERLAASRRRLQVTDCLFCNSAFPSLEENLTHMASTHSFFIPEAEYLIDLPGLIGYLGEKIAIGNACLYCNRHDGKGREFRNLGAVRKHMIDKSHCKIAYSSEEDQLELGDYYDFTSSYPDAKQSADDDEGEWEDMDEEDGEADEDAEVIDVEDSSEPPDSDIAEEDDDEIPPSQITYGDSHTELVLPSGARIGHRSMKRYYDQRFRPSAPVEGEDPKSGTALVRRLLREKNSALVPAKGGYGAYGRGNQLIKARNPGEAKEAGRHIREFRDQRRREEFKTKVGFIHNSQKHFRDPLLQ